MLLNLAVNKSNDLSKEKLNVLKYSANFMDEFNLEDEKEKEEFIEIGLRICQSVFNVLKTQGLEKDVEDAMNRDSYNLKDDRFE
ncbi:hypothetical protein [Clostridioides difficile]|uniref:hypothetical protein n=1 Tax=Clostridioides difficile TaxID=1496 RepID=UPI000D1F0CC0|nr:hypothetical protein [Clostridioides difficile]HBE9444631.1 hypothetical protein [Clostridioides difficile]